MSYAQKRVLVVDDMNLARERARQGLIKLGFDAGRIKDAVNGRDALDQLEAAFAAGEPFELILCDWNMPEMTGLELLKACRANANLARIKFMIVSSEGESNSVVEAIESGADEYAVKPVGGEELTNKISKMFA